MAKRTYDESTPVLWRSNSDQIAESFGDEFAAKWDNAFDAFYLSINALLAEAPDLLRTKDKEGNTVMVKAPTGKETVVFHGKGRSIGIKFLEPSEAQEAKPKAKSDKPSLEAQLAALGATLVKKGQTMKDAGVMPTPTIVTTKAKRA